MRIDARQHGCLFDTSCSLQNCHPFPAKSSAFVTDSSNDSGVSSCQNGQQGPPRDADASKANASKANAPKDATDTWSPVDTGRSFYHHDENLIVHFLGTWSDGEKTLLLDAVGATKANRSRTESPTERSSVFEEWKCTCVASAGTMLFFATSRSVDRVLRSPTAKGLARAIRGL